MSIIKLKNSPYYYTRFKIKGILVYESTKTESLSEAKRYEDKRRQQVREQILFGIKPSYFWKDATHKWMLEKFYKRSLKDDIKIIKWLSPNLDKFYLRDISRNVIDEVVKKKCNVKPATINHILKLIRSILRKACFEWEWIDKMPVIKLLPDKNERIKYLTREQAKLLISYLPVHKQLQVMFSLCTGLREKELRNLKWEHINFDLKIAVIISDNSKNGETGSIPLNQDALNILEKLKGENEVFIFSYKGKPITRSCNTKSWRKALARAGIIDFHWHDLRHTWASWHAQNGTSLHVLMKLGRWKSIKMVLKYAHLCPEQIKEAAEAAKKLDNLVTKVYTESNNIGDKDG